MKIPLLLLLLFTLPPAFAQDSRPNVLLIISDDLNTTALGTYGNPIAHTPNIDQLAREGMVFERAYSQFPVCGPSRASLMFGYYPSASQTYGYTSGRENVGEEKVSLTQHFKQSGYYTARVSKIFHMGVPIDIETGSDGQDDPASWTEKFNSQALEWKTPGKAELVQNNPDGSIERKGGNVMTIVQAAGDELMHSDGLTAQKAVELIHTKRDTPFFLAVGLVRPHVPFVAPARYFERYPWRQIIPPPVVRNDWHDIPPRGINYVTTQNGHMNYPQKQKAIAGYLASVSFMDAQVGKILQALREAGLERETIIVFTSDHGFHLGEHDFWMKVSLHEESVRVPLVIKTPGIKPSRSHALVELLDLFPTLTELAALDPVSGIQGKSLVPILRNPAHQIREFAFSVSQGGKTFLIRTKRWAYIQYDEQAQSGMELFDMDQDPYQYTNLAQLPAYQEVLLAMQSKLREKLEEVRNNDLGIHYPDKDPDIPN